MQALTSQRPNAIYSHGHDRIVIFEPMAIARYLDEGLSLFASPNEDFETRMPLADKSDKEYASTVLYHTEISQLMSMIATHVKTAVVDRYVLPYFALRNNDAKADDIAVALQDALENVHSTLIVVENVIARTQERVGVTKSKWILGEKVTWADVLLFPMLRDLKAAQQNFLQGDRLPWLSAWLERFEKRPSAQQTLRGTFASSAN